MWEKKNKPELQEVLRGRGIDPGEMIKPELIDAIMRSNEHQTPKEIT